MATYTFTNGADNLIGTPGTADRFEVANLADLTAGDTVAGTISENNTQDQLVLLPTATGTLTLSATALPTIVGLEGVSIDGGNTNGYIFNVNYDFFANNADVSNNFRFNLANSTGNHSVNVSGTPGKNAWVSLGSGNSSVYGGTGTEQVSINTGIDLASLGAGDDSVLIDSPAQLSVSDTLDGGVGGTDFFYFGGAGTYTASQLANVTNFEYIIFWPVSGSQNTTIPASFASGAVQAQIQNANAGRVIDVSAWTHSFNITSNVSTSSQTIAGGAGDDTLRGGLDADSLVGNAGADFFVGSGGIDTIRGGGGADTISYANLSEFNQDLLADFSSGDVIVLPNAVTLAGGTGNGSSGLGAYGAQLDPSGTVIHIDTTGDGSADGVINLGFAHLIGQLSTSGNKIISNYAPTFAFTGSLDSFAPNPGLSETFTAAAPANIASGDSLMATPGEAPSVADIIKLTAGGQTYGFLGASLTNIQGVEAIWTDGAGQITVNVDTAFLANNYDSNGQLYLQSLDTAAHNHFFGLTGNAVAGKYFMVALPGMSSTTNDTVQGSNGPDGVMLNGLGDDSVAFGAGDDTLVVSNFTQISVGDTLTGGLDTDSLVLSGGGVLNTASYPSLTGFERIQIGALSSLMSVTVTDAYAATVTNGTIDVVAGTASGAFNLIISGAGLSVASKLRMTAFSAIALTVDGGAGADTIYGSGLSDWLTGGDGADEMRPGGSTDVVYLGVDSSADTVIGSVADLAGDSIGNMGTGDRIVVTGTTFGGVMATTGGGSGITPGWIQVDPGGTAIYLDTDNNGSGETLINLGGTYTPANFTVSGATIFFGAGGGGGGTLTGTVETLTGTAGNDTFTAAAANIQAGDSLTGGGGVDVLTLTGGGSFDLNQIAGLGSINHITSDGTAKTIILPTATATKLIGGSANETVTITGGNHSVWGGGGSDALAITGGIVTAVSNGGLDDGYMAITFSGTGSGTLFLQGDQVTGSTSGAVTVVANTGTKATTAVAMPTTTGPVTAFLSIAYSAGVTGSGNDALYGGLGSQHFVAGLGDDTLVGGGGFDVLIGGDGNDALAGEDDTDLLFADQGQDSLYGGTGRDVFVLGSGGIDLVADFNPAEDLLNLSAFGVTDFATFSSLFTPTPLANGVRYLTSNPAIGFDIVTSTPLVAANFLFGSAMVGQAVGDSFSGTAQADLILGLGGDDTLIGGGDNDTLSGGAGTNTLTGGTGSDIFFFDALSSQGPTTAHITDFVAGTDRIRLAVGDSPMGLPLTTGTSFALGAPVSGVAATVDDVRTLAGIVAASTGAVVQVTPVQVTSGALAGQTYLIFNDATVGPNTTDMAIRVDVVGTLSAADFAAGTIF
ncbi:MAG: hypothetical protein SF002_14560 [Alphaproteobacteria bacterium]|nr:hypothetical protein [Alphaproteobacteria bacterium]